MPAEHPVPNSATFDMQDVTYCLYNDAKGSGISRNLVQCISDANYNESRWDEAYRGSRNSLYNFRNFRTPILTWDNNTYQWAYNSQSVQWFQATCNHTYWRILGTSSYENFSVSVWDSNKANQLSTPFPTGAYLKVYPTSNNSGGSSRYATIYIGDDLGYNWSCTWTGEQLANVSPPTCSGSSSTSGWTMTLNNYSATIGDSQIYWQFTMSGMPAGFQTVYYSIWDGYSSVGGGTIASVKNGIQKSIWLNVSGNVQGNRNYNLDINDGA